MQLQKIGALIKEGRIKKGMNQTALAELLHVSVAAVSKWETGKNIPDMSNMEKIAQILDIPIHELLGISLADAESEPAAAPKTGSEHRTASEPGKESEPAAAPKDDMEEKVVLEPGTGSKSAAMSEAGGESKMAPGAARIFRKKRRLWILSAILAGFCVGGILFWINRAFPVQQETAIVNSFRGKTMYGVTNYVIIEYTEEPTNDYLNRQAVDFRSEHPEYFMEVEAVLLLYFQHYDASTDDESTADFMVLILN